MSAFVCKSSEKAQVLMRHCVRRYARGIKRTPIKVTTPEEELKLLKAKGIGVKDPRHNAFLPFIPGDPTQNQFTQKVRNNREPPPSAAKAAASKKQPEPKLQGKNFGIDSRHHLKEVTKSGLKYEKLQDGDKRFGRVLMAAKSRKEREKSGLIMLEGRRLVVDALHAGARLKYLYFSDVSLVSSLPAELLGDADIFKVQFRHLKTWADTQTPAGIIGVFAKPAVGEVVCPQDDSLPLTLICDNVRDPGNLGTMIRTAAAVGCSKIITTKGCADVWDPKVLRGAMGGHFHTCILNSLTWEEITNHIPPSTYLCIADSRKGSTVEKSFDANHPKVRELFIAAEADTSSADGETDAGDSSSTEEEESSSSSEEEEEESRDSDQSWTKENSKVYEHVPMSVVQYSDMECAGVKDIAVIVGGETKGVSSQAKKLAFDLYGQYVTIPMVAAADSLNAATAAAVVLYEVRRQLTEGRQGRDLHKIPEAQGAPSTS